MQRWGRGLDGSGSCSSPAAVAGRPCFPVVQGRPCGPLAVSPRGAARVSRRRDHLPVSPTAGRGRTADRLSRSGADRGDWSLWFAAISRRRCPPRRGCTGRRCSRPGGCGGLFRVRSGSAPVGPRACGARLGAALSGRRLDAVRGPGSGPGDLGGRAGADAVRRPAPVAGEVPANTGPEGRAAVHGGCCLGSGVDADGTARGGPAEPGTRPGRRCCAPRKVSLRCRALIAVSKVSVPGEAEGTSLRASPRSNGR